MLMLQDLFLISTRITPTKIIAAVVVVVILILAYVYFSRRSRTT